MSDESVASVVEAARRGSPDAWTTLIDRFQDVAVAIALGRLGDVEAARDASQDAFGLAFRHLDDLADPAAFPAWFTRLVRTACARQYRRRRAVAVPLEGAAPACPTVDPAAVVVGRDEAERVRAAVEALPEQERTVVALHYLAGLSYPEVAAFLGIGPSTARKRAFTARGRMKELLPMTAHQLAGSRPSRDGRFRDTILLFAAIRRRDHEAVADLLARDPELAHAREDWTAEEAFAAGLPYASQASALIRAAVAGDLALVRLLVRAGAEPGAPCACAGAETPLWAAAAAGWRDVVAFLLGAGADPDAAAFAGATPLHVAAMRGHDDLGRLLLAAGADPGQADDGGRVAADWTALPRPALPAPGDLVPTGIRALDLFAPLRRGHAQRWPAAYGLGQFVVLAEVAGAVAPAPTWWIGFAQGLIDRVEIAHLQHECSVPGEIRVAPRDARPTAARALFARALDEITAPGRTPGLVICLDAPGHAHDVAAALPRLASSAGVLATLVVEPFAGELPAAGLAVPEGYDSQVAFDRGRLDRGVRPAIDPLRTLCRAYPSERHARLAAAARADGGEALLRALTQPLVVAEPFTSVPGERTPYGELLDAVEAILAG